MERINIAFEFGQRTYRAEILINGEKGRRAFKVILTDAHLEQLLHGNELIWEQEGSLQANILATNKDQTELKLIIATCLAKHLGMPCFAGDCCLPENPHKEGWEELHPISRHDAHYTSHV